MRKQDISPYYSLSCVTPSTPTHLPFLQVEVGIVLAGELPDLDQEVSQVVLEARDVLPRNHGGTGL